jgi:hypothetical protein
MTMAASTTTKATTVSAVAWIVWRDARDTFALRSIAVWAALVTVAGLFLAPFNTARARVLQTVMPSDRAAQGFAILSAYTAG